MGSRRPDLRGLRPDLVGAVLRRDAPADERRARPHEGPRGLRRRVLLGRLPRQADAHTAGEQRLHVAADGRRRSHRQLRAERPTGRVAASGAGLRQYPLQPAGPGQHRQRRPAEDGVVVLRRYSLRPRGRAAGRRRHDVHRHAVSQRRLRHRPVEARLSDQVDLSSRTRTRSPSARPAATRSTAARRSPTASWSSPCSTTRRWPSTPRPARPLWRTRLDDPAKGATITMSPLVVGNIVYVGDSGGELGVRGRLTALDLNTGKVLWTAWSTGAGRRREDRARLPAPPTRSATARISASPPGRATPGSTAARTVWGYLSYDPDAKLIYYGTANPSPRVPAQRPGDNLWSSSDVRPRPGDRRGEVGLPVHAARPVGLRRGQREHPDRRHDRRAAAQADGPPRPQRLRLHHGPADRPHRAGQALRRHQLGQGDRSRHRAARSSIRTRPPRSSAR